MTDENHDLTGKYPNLKNVVRVIMSQIKVIVFGSCPNSLKSQGDQCSLFSKLEFDTKLAFLL